MINIEQRYDGEVQLTMSSEELCCIIDSVFSDALNISVWLKKYSNLGTQGRFDLASEAEEMMSDHKRLMAIYNELMTSVAINHIDLDRKGDTGHGRV